MSLLKYSQMSIAEIDVIVKAKCTSNNELMATAEALQAELLLNILPTENDAAVLFYIIGYCYTSSHHHSNVIYQFLCHCDSRYVGRTSQRLEERIKQHVPRSITNPRASANGQSLSRSCKNNTRPQQFHESAIGQHLLDNAQCALHYSNEKFSILARGRSSFHLSALEATFIKSLNPLLCKQKEFIYSLKIS